MTCPQLFGAYIVAMRPNPAEPDACPSPVLRRARHAPVNLVALERTLSSSDPTTMRHIADHGCTVIHVMESGDLPAFAYSVGITQEVGEPDVCVVGLKKDIAHFVVNEYNRRVRCGERFPQLNTDPPRRAFDRAAWAG